MEKVNLQELQKKYESELCDRSFVFELENNKNIEIVFFREQFCHLLGIQYIFEHDRRFIGRQGYNKILNGDITSESLQKHNSKQFSFIKERLQNFNKIKNIVTTGELIKFYPERAKPKTKIAADFIIFQNEEAHILHLFLRQERQNSNVYAPVSFVIKSLNDKSKHQFIDNQEYKKIIKRTIINKS